MSVESTTMCIVLGAMRMHAGSKCWHANISISSMHLAGLSQLSVFGTQGSVLEVLSLALTDLSIACSLQYDET